MAESSSRLDSWKEIARHLGRDIRTVIRWEADRGLPVHRVPGTKRSVVFAYREELDAWLAQDSGSRQDAAPDESPARIPVAPTADSITGDDRTPRTGITRPYLFALGGAALLLAAAAVFVFNYSWTSESRRTASLAIEANELRARDAEGRVLWTHRFEGTVNQASGRWTHIGDLDGDNRAEIVAVLHIQRDPGGEVVDEMWCFSETGKLLWTRTPAAHLKFRDAEYGPPWTSEDLIAFESNGTMRLAWAVRHNTWWPSMVIVLDGSGEERGRYVNSGWIRSLAVSHDGRLLLASGITNAARAHFLAVLDADRVEGSSPEAADSAYACLECNAAGPLRYFVFPRTDVGEQAVFPPQHAPVIQTFADGTTQLRVSENSERNGAEVLYELSPIDTLRRARPTDSFWESHRRLAESGHRHNQDSCPLRGFLEVREWEPQQGWRTLRVTAANIEVATRLRRP